MGFPSSPWMNRNFKLVTIEMGVSRFGTSAFDLMVMWILLHYTGSAFLAGLGDGMLSLPLLLSFIVGAIVDKLRRRKLIAEAAAGVRSIALIPMIMAVMRGPEILVVASSYVAAFLLGMTSDILNSIRTTWSKEFLGEDEYKSGSGSYNAVGSLAEAIGFAVPGLLLGIGYSLAILSLLMVFLSSIIPLALIKAKPSISSEGGVSSSIREGLAFIKGNAFMLQFIVISLAANLVFGMSGILFTDLVEEEFKLPPIYMSMLLVTIMIMSILGSIMATRLRGSVGIISAIAMAIMGAAAASIGFIGNVYLDEAPTAVIGVALGVINVVTGAAMLKAVPSQMMARAQGAINTFALTATFLSGAVGGLIIDVATLRGAFLVVGVFLAIIAVIITRLKAVASISV